MLTRRIIPCLDVRDGRVVKGVRFRDLRDAGDPVLQAQRYETQGADEIVMLDVSATDEGRAAARETVRMRSKCSTGISLGLGKALSRLPRMLSCSWKRDPFCLRKAEKTPRNPRPSIIPAAGGASSRFSSIAQPCPGRRMRMR